MQAIGYYDFRQLNVPNESLRLPAAGRTCNIQKQTHVGSNKKEPLKQHKILF